MKRFVQWALAGLLVLLGLGAATREDRREERVVVAARDLARYSVLTPQDVTTAPRHVEGGDMVKEPDLTVGKVLLESVAKHRMVPASRLVDRGLIEGRVPVTVVATVSPDAPGVGKVADLIVSPREKNAEGIVAKAVTVLTVAKRNDSVSYTVGVTDLQRELLARLLGFSDVRVTRPSLA